MHCQLSQMPTLWIKNVNVYLTHNIMMILENVLDNFFLKYRPSIISQLQSLLPTSCHTFPCKLVTRI